MAAVGARRVDVEAVEQLRDEADLAGPLVVRPVDREYQVEVVAVLPHVELMAEQDLVRSAGAVQDRDLAELVTVVVDVVDEALERGDAQPAGHEQDVVALHLLEREAAAERPAQSHDVAALALVHAPRSRRRRCGCTAR